MKKMILQAYLISKNGGALREIPVYGVPPKIFSKGKSICRLVRIKNLGPKRIVNTFLRRSDPPLENWNKWLGGILKGVISKLIFTENSRIKDYIAPGYINSLQNRLSDSFIPKLATAEIILRLFFEANKEMAREKGEFVSSGRHGKG